MIRPPALQAGPLLLLAGCAPAVTPAPIQAPAPTTCEATLPAPTPPPPTPAPPPTLPLAACEPKHPAPPSRRAKPHLDVGDTRIYLAPCTEPGRSPEVERAAEDPVCHPTPHDTFEVCAPAIVKQAISPTSFLHAKPAEGEELLVRGRLAVSGPRGPGETATLGLVGYRDHFGTCLMAHLFPAPGAPADAWQCSAPPSASDMRLCCNERPSRPPTGVDLVVRARVKKVLVGPRVELFGLAELEVASVCVVAGTPGTTAR